MIPFRWPRAGELALPIARQEAAQLHRTLRHGPDPGRDVRREAEAAVQEAQGQHDAAGDGARELDDVRRDLLPPRRGEEGPVPLRRGPAQE